MSSTSWSLERLTGWASSIPPERAIALRTSSGKILEVPKKVFQTFPQPTNEASVPSVLRTPSEHHRPTSPSPSFQNTWSTLLKVAALITLASASSKSYLVLPSSASSVSRRSEGRPRSAREFRARRARRRMRDGEASSDSTRREREREGVR